LDMLPSFISRYELDIENHELIQYRNNKVLYYVNDYLIRKRRLQTSVQFFTELTKDDKKCAAFIVDVFACMHQHPATIKLLSPILEKNPHISVLLYQEADTLLKAEQYELALILTRTVIQLSPDSFDAWFLLAEIYFYSKHYNEALLAINMCPFYSKGGFNNGILEPKPKEVIVPKVCPDVSSHAQYMFEPSVDNYRTMNF